MKTAIITASGRPGPDKSSYGWREAFAEGLRRRGWQAEVSTSPKPCDLLVLWGVRRNDLIARQKGEGGEIVVLERGYLGDRFDWTSVSFGGGLNGRGIFTGPHEDGSRFERHFAHLMKPWQTGGSYALLIGQVPGDQSIRHIDIEAFYHQSAASLRKHGWPDVRFRPHPKAGGHARSGAGIARIGGELHEAMAGAGVVMTFNSNTGVEAALYGRPVIAMDRGSMAWEIAGHQVTEIVTPDRTAWAHRLAWCQWQIDEFRSGYCMEAIGL